MSVPDFRLHGPEDGRPVILSNALGPTSAVWDAQLPALAARYQVLTYEPAPRATVEALAEDVLELATTAGLDRFSFCGLSLGAMVGMRLALSAPERIDRLVLACTSARFGAPAEWKARASLVGACGMQAVAADALEKWFTPGFEDRARFLEMQLAASPDDYALGLEAIGRFDARDEIASIEAPTLVVAGADDTATPPADGGYLARRIPDADLVVLPGAAHLANVERADAFNAVLLAHLAR
ncbi:MAG TPA: alpha/beta fold hydrolase [Gaiellaceae bacterium]